jgi:hypothetical protein
MRYALRVAFVVSVLSTLLIVAYANTAYSNIRRCLKR